MIKQLFKLLLVVCASSSTLLADPFLGECIDSQLALSYSYYQKEWVIGLSDGSCWKVAPMKKKPQQSWSQWWSGSSPKEWDLPETYFFDPLSWKGGYTVSVYKARDAISPEHTHIIENEVTGQKVFARYTQSTEPLLPKNNYALNLIKNAELRSSELLNSYPFLGDIIILEDGTAWNLYFVKENSKTLEEWWNNTKIDQPDGEFLSSMNQWLPRDLIDVYIAQVDDATIQNKYGVTNPAYQAVLLNNRTTGKFAYASFVPLHQLLDRMRDYAQELSEQAFKDGSEKGYRNGYKDGNSQGFADGFRKGVASVSKQVDKQDTMDSDSYESNTL